jgi:hypothetical protein
VSDDVPPESIVEADPLPPRDDKGPTHLVAPDGYVPTQTGPIEVEHAEYQLDLSQFEGHTPGPWYEDEDGYTMGNATDDDADLVAETKFERDVDSRLALAAPKLLAEVKRLRAELAQEKVEYEHASAQADAAITERREARRECDRLRRERTKFDCRYTLGSVADVSGVHCPPGELCLRCERDRYREALERIEKEGSCGDDSVEAARGEMMKRYAIDVRLLRELPDGNWREATADESNDEGGNWVRYEDAVAEVNKWRYRTIEVQGPSGKTLYISGGDAWPNNHELDIASFMRAAAEAEREACAQVADEYAITARYAGQNYEKAIAAQIRARGEGGAK